MRTFHMHTLGCKVNQYESEQIATLLRARGLIESSPDAADLRLVNTCAVTTQAAAKSRQAVQRSVSLPILTDPSAILVSPSASHAPRIRPARVVAVGCWTTSDPAQAAKIPGLHAILTHRHNVAAELDALLTRWGLPPVPNPQPVTAGGGRKEITRKNDSGVRSSLPTAQPPSLPLTTDNLQRATVLPSLPPSQPATRNPQLPLHTQRTTHNPQLPPHLQPTTYNLQPPSPSLPLLHSRIPGRQRAHLKIQDGCDAHCTYCIIPSLRPAPWSKPADSVIAEARALVAAGHRELVITGIFLGAYGQPTALRRRQSSDSQHSLARLVRRLGAEVPDLHRLRLSSIEPGDLTDDLLAALASNPQVVPHFHIPLQSGDDDILRRMNRQYRRSDYLDMLARLNGAFDRPALTTDIIVGFPGETDEQFARTRDIADRAAFLHIHAFPFSPRPGTAAARWTADFVPADTLRTRLAQLADASTRSSLAFRRQFLGQTVEVLVERDPSNSPLGHGRCERYFDVHFPTRPSAGAAVTVRINSIDANRTLGAPVATPPSR